MLKPLLGSVFLTSVLTLACTEKGRSVVLVDLDAESTVTGLAKGGVVVFQGTNQLGSIDGDWPLATPLKLGVFLSKTVSGEVTVFGCGFDDHGTNIAVKSDTADVQPGGTFKKSITLGAGADPQHCKIGGGGAAGSGGGAGSAGVAGTGGATAGTGGASAGAGGGGGGAGTGVSGTGGGSAGTGGGSGGASGGSAGTGGSAGSAGRAGTTGTTGTAGAVGTGGGGSGGRGGAAGTGAAGTGGSTQVPMWHGAVGVGADPAINESDPAVAVDGSGNAVVVYVHGSEVWANHFTAATNAWGTPVGIDTRPGIGLDQAGGVQVGVDKNGTYTALWATDENGSLKGIYSSLSTDGIHWAPIITIATGVDWTPVLGVNAEGAAVAAWTEAINSGNLWQVAASVRPSTTGAWSAEQIMRPGDDNFDRNPVVAISGTGEAFVGWEQSDGGTPDQISVWMRQHTSTGWNAAALMESYDAGPAYGISISANTSGNAILTFLQIGTATTQLLSRRYAPGSGLAPALKVGEASSIEWLFYPTVTLDDAGMATAAFAYSIGGKFNVYTNRSAATDAAWPSAMAMETDNAATDDDKSMYYDQVPDPLVACDPAGNVTLVWRKRSGARFDLWTRRFSGGIWNPATLLETRDTNSAWVPALAVGADGTAVAAWYYPNEYDVWANVYR